MVLALLLVVVLGVVQAALLLHARDVAAASAAEGARYAANSGHLTSEGGPYAERALHDALGAAYASHLHCASAGDRAASVSEVRVDCVGDLPLRVFGVGTIHVHVVGHALAEPRS
jgi:Flp pilus assembly protein TadG